MLFRKKSKKTTLIQCTHVEKRAFKYLKSFKKQIIFYLLCKGSNGFNRNRNHHETRESRFTKITVIPL